MTAGQSNSNSRVTTWPTQSVLIRILKRTARVRVGLNSGTDQQKLAGVEPTPNRGVVRLLAGSLIRAQDEERKRISHELHDSLGGDIVALSAKISLIRNKLSPGTESINLALQELQQQVVALGRRIRTISHNLHPALLEYVGLTAALDKLCTECLHEGLRVRMALPKKQLKLDKQVELCLFRVAQEALRNILRHTRCRTAYLKLGFHARNTVMTIRDRGIGFDLGQKRSGLGLISMQERVCLVLGSLEVHSLPGCGTRIHVTIPGR
jgi:signal transduction histidine kinase